MKRSIFILISHLLLISTLFFSCEKKNTDNADLVRYNDEVFDTYTVMSDIVYDSNYTQSGILQNLKLDIYSPENDTIENRPVIIYAHSGGFTDGDKAEANRFAPFFVKSGYVVASINYRLVDVEQTQQVFSHAVLDAVADMRSAVRYLKQQSQSIGIDTNKIFIGGYSAGAFTALHSAYTNSMADVAILGGDDLVLYVNSRGGLDGGGSNPGCVFSFKGAYSFAGAIGSIDIINPGESILCCFHGSKDMIVPVDSGNVTGVGAGTYVYGSQSIHNKLTEVGILNEFYLVDGASHSSLAECDDCPEKLRQFIFDNLE